MDPRATPKRQGKAGPGSASACMYHLEKDYST
jgi:hypothetical protein